MMVNEAYVDTINKTPPHNLFDLLRFNFTESVVRNTDVKLAITNSIFYA